MLGFGSLFLCGSMLRNATFEEKLEAAGAAGYAGVSVRPDEVHAAVRRAGSASAVRRMVEDLGLEIADFDAVGNWLDDDFFSPSTPAGGDEVLIPAALVELAAGVGARA